MNGLRALTAAILMAITAPPGAAQEVSLSFEGLGGAGVAPAGIALEFEGLGGPETAPAGLSLEFEGLGGPGVAPVGLALAFDGMGGALNLPQGGAVHFAGIRRDLAGLGGQIWFAGIPLTLSISNHIRFRGLGTDLAGLHGTIYFAGVPRALSLPGGGAVSFAGSAGAAPCPPAPGDAARFPGNGSYAVYTCRTDWASARAACQAAGGDLVSIETAAEATALTDILNICRGNGCWIGAHDRREEGQFEWVSGRPVTFANWSDGEPNDHCDGEDVVHVIPGTLRWNDQENAGGCNNWGPMQFICEW